jgi:hypothetical protein
MEEVVCGKKLLKIIILDLVILITFGEEYMPEDPSN